MSREPYDPIEHIAESMERIADALDRVTKPTLTVSSMRTLSHSEVVEMWEKGPIPFAFACYPDDPPPSPERTA